MRSENGISRTVCCIFSILILAGIAPRVALSEVGVTKDTIKVGMFAALTGSQSWSGEGIRDSALLYFEEVNKKGGINGRKIELIAEDDACTPRMALSAAKKLVEQHKVFAIFGGGCSNAHLAAIPYLIENKIPYYNSISANPGITDPFSRYIFQGETVNDIFMGVYMADFAVQQLGYRNLAIINDSGQYGKTGAEIITKRLNDKYKLKPVENVTFNANDTDFSSQIMKLKEAKPEMTFVYGYPQEGAIIVRQGKELGLSTHWFCCVSIWHPLFAKLAGEAAIGALLLNYFPHILETSNSPKIVEYREKFKARYPNATEGRPNPHDQLSYGGAQAFVEGIRRAGKDLTRERLIDALESLKDFRGGVTFPVTYTKTDHKGNKATRVAVILPNQRREDLGYVLTEKGIVDLEP